MNEPEVVVVGAGPAGCATAIQLAQLGRRVLLLDRGPADGPARPTGAAPGWGVTRDPVRRLRELGALGPPAADGTVVRGVEIHMRGRRTRELRYSDVVPTSTGTAVAADAGEVDGGRVLSRGNLVAGLLKAVRRAGVEIDLGAEVVDLVMSDRQVRGVMVRGRDGTATRVPCRIVVAADGASSTLAVRAGLRAPLVAATGEQAADGAGHAVHTTLTGPATTAGPGDLLAFHLPLADATDRHVLPSCGWVFPGEHLQDPASGAWIRTTTVGVALFENPDPAASRALLGRFLADLRASDPWFDRAQQGGVSGGLVRLDVDPSRSSAPGLVLVGDAAGLTSAFTAEGLSGALESAALAATAVHDSLGAPGSAAAPDPTGYGPALSARFGGYMVSGRHAVRRYHLSWRVLQATFDDDRPLFAMSRRAVLFPEATHADDMLDPLPVAGPDLTRRLRRELVDVGEVLASTVREQWPHFVRVAGVDRDLAGLRLRPSVLLLIASHVGRGGPDSEDGRPAHAGTSLATSLAAAVDLGALSALASDSTADDTTQSLDSAEEHTGGPIPWGNRFAVLVADFLMARAYELSIRGGAGAVTLFAEALAATCEGRVHELRAVASGRDVTSDEQFEILSDKAAAGFELPCRLGAMLAGCSLPVTTALRRYGRRLGVAYAMLEELRRAAGEAPPWLPLPVGAGLQVAERERMRETAVRNARSAEAVLRGVPDGEARDLLRSVAAGVAAAAAGEEAGSGVGDG